MRRLCAGLAAALVVAAVIDALGDLTQDRPDRVVPGSRSEIVLEVRTRSSEPPASAAQRLWTVCEGTVDSRLVETGLVEGAAGAFVAVMEPAVGQRAWRRLQGCLEDATLDRVKGDALAKDDHYPTGG